MTVKKDDDKVWIEGVNGFHPGIYASSVHGAQARILETLGEKLSYDDLIGYSGFAFRVGLHDAMCPSAGHPCCGYMCIDNGVRALPWETKVFEALPWAKATEDIDAFQAEARAAIRDSIDRGVPVHYGSEEDGLIIGYADEGKRWLCTHPYHKWGKETFWHDEAQGFAGGKWPWGIVVWTKPKERDARAVPSELLKTALQQAVDMWHTEKRGDYFVGEAAYREWLKWLRNVENGQIDDAAAGMQGNGWCYDVLLHSRRIANRWLRNQAADLHSDVKADLLSAADHYRDMVKTLSEGIDCPWSLAPPPERVSDWTSNLRKDEIRRLKIAWTQDQKAITAIKKALEKWETEKQ